MTDHTAEPPYDPTYHLLDRQLDEPDDPSAAEDPGPDHESFADVASERQCQSESAHRGHVWYGPQDSYWCEGFVGRAGVPAEPLAQGGIVTPDAQPQIEDGGDYLAPADILRAAADAANDAICRRLDHNQVIALVADAVWRLAYERGHANGHRKAVAAVQRPDQLAYERGIAEGRRQATEGWERRWNVDEPVEGLLWGEAGTTNETSARTALKQSRPDSRVVSRLVGPWEPAPSSAESEGAGQ